MCIRKILVICIKNVFLIKWNCFTLEESYIVLFYGIYIKIKIRKKWILGKGDRIYFFFVM